MVDILKQVEAIPATYPATPGFDRAYGPDDGAPDAAVVWQRIERYIAHRWTEREVVWTLEGAEGDDWQPPLTPVNSHTAEKWESGAWVAVTLETGPLGFCLPSGGTFRITASVGGGTVPADAAHSYKRLSEYMRGNDAAYMDENRCAEAGMALQLSGAADLLRPYRRA